jgi:hypothetical protein
MPDRFLQEYIDNLPVGRFAGAKTIASYLTGRCSSRKEVKVLIEEIPLTFSHRFITRVFSTIILAATAFAQPSNQGASGETKSEEPSALLPATSAAQDQPPATQENSGGKQSDRILGVIPNYRAVSADAHLPPLSFTGKFKLATEDSFDYSSLLVAGTMAGISQARNQTPEFHQGGAGFGRYFWHSFTDQAVGNYFTEFIVPAATHEDPRYYTLGHGNIFKRTGYSIGRLFITRTDPGGRSFNFSEIVGNGTGAGISNLYYPSQERTWTKTGQKWASQVALDGIFNVMKEFWPDVRHRIFHQ